MQPAPDTLDAAKVALFLDVDGTLLQLRDNPADVVANGILIESLQRCSERLEGAMALVSGRSIVEIDRIFEPRLFPAAGAHGAELRMHNGQIESAADASLPGSAIEPLQKLVARHEKLLLELKPGGVSVHYRRAPGLEAECRDIVHRVLDELGDDYRLIAGKKVFEIAARAHNKGGAIRKFLMSRPFAGRRPVFVGDDVTDEDGFRVVNEFDGMSIRVGNNADSEARYTLASVNDVLTWLQDAILGPQTNKNPRGPDS